MGSGFLQLPLVPQNLAKVDVSLGHAGIDPNRLTEFGGGLVQFLLVTQNRAEVNMSFSKLGIDSDRLAKLSGGLVHLALVDQDVAAFEMNAVLGRVLPRSISVPDGPQENQGSDRDRQGQPGLAAGPLSGRSIRRKNPVLSIIDFARRQAARAQGLPRRRAMPAHRTAGKLSGQDRPSDRPPWFG